MKVIKSSSIGRLHELAVAHIKKYGYEIVTEDGEHTLESEPLALVCSTPFDAYRISTCSSLRKTFMDEYANKLINGYSTYSTFEYDYHSRLFDYAGVNQIDYIVSKLREHPESRRAQAITWMPDRDTSVKDVPCLQYIQCSIRNDVLDMSVMFRSNDMLLAFGSNAYALTMLQDTIAEQLDVGIGTYTHISMIPHIYDIRDSDELKRYVV